MKKAYLFTIILFFASQLLWAQNETVTVLKGGITVLQFSNNVSQYNLGSKNDYNINVEDDQSIRIWAKAGVIKPQATTLTIVEGNKTHQINILFKEKGDYNSTVYDFTKKVETIASVPTKIIENTPTVSSPIKSTANSKVEERARILAEEKLKREEQLKNKKTITAKQIETQKAEKEQIELNTTLTNEKIIAERNKAIELQKQIDKLKNNQPVTVTKTEPVKSNIERLSKAEEINLANAKKAREENEIRLQNQEKLKQEKLQAIDLEKQKREQLIATIAAEKQKQAELDAKIATDKKVKAEKLIAEQKAKEAQRLAEEKLKLEQQLAEAKRIEQEKRLAEQKVLEEKRLAEQKALEERQKLLAIEKQKQLDAINALNNSKKEQAELVAKLEAEKKQREELEKILQIEQQKRIAKEKELVNQTATNTTAVANTVLNSNSKIEVNNNSQAEIAPTTNTNETINTKNLFPTINFKQPPTGQIFEINTSYDTVEYYKNTQPLLTKNSNPEYENAATEFDGIKIKLKNITQKNGVAYLHFSIENTQPDYFLVGPISVKILEAESGVKHQLNPYYISSFPIISGNSTANIVYVLKADKTIPPNSFVLINFRERQTNKKYELNFPGNFYTNAIK